MKKNTPFFFAISLIVCKDGSKETDETSQNDKMADSVATAKPTNYLWRNGPEQTHFAGTADPWFRQNRQWTWFMRLEYGSIVRERCREFSHENTGSKPFWIPWKHAVSATACNVLIMVDNEGDLSFNDETATQQAVETTRSGDSEFLGCHSIRVNLFGEEDPDARVKNSVRSFKALCAYAAPKTSTSLWKTMEACPATALVDARHERSGFHDWNCWHLARLRKFLPQREGGERWGAPCVEEYDRYKGLEELIPFCQGCFGQIVCLRRQWWWNHDRLLQNDGHCPKTPILTVSWGLNLKALKTIPGINAKALVQKALQQ